MKETAEEREREKEQLFVWQQNFTGSFGLIGIEGKIIQSMT